MAQQSPRIPRLVQTWTQVVVNRFDLVQHFHPREARISIQAEVPKPRENESFILGQPSEQLIGNYS